MGHLTSRSPSPLQEQDYQHFWAGTNVDARTLQMNKNSTLLHMKVCVIIFYHSYIMLLCNRLHDLSVFDGFRAWNHPHY